MAPFVVGNTLSTVATNPSGGTFSNDAVATMTWSGKYDFGLGLTRSFSKTTPLVFPGIVITCPHIPSRGTATASIQLATILDFPMTLDLAGQDVTLGSSSVTFPANQKSTQTVAVTAPQFLCKNAPTAVEAGLCVGGQIIASSKFGGTATVFTRNECAPIACEGPR